MDRLKGRELARLQELAAWREETAQALNLPPRRICADAVLLTLARRPRRSVKELQGMRGLRPHQVERFGKGLIGALQAAEDVPTPSLNRPAPLPARLEPTVDFLMLCLRRLAADAEISHSLLATRADLDQVVLSGGSADVPLMSGWRRRVAGESILQALKGEATARVSPDGHHVLLEWRDGASDTAGD
jgi:ribonuclease D